MKVFISGRISGIKYKTAKTNFRKAEKYWQAKGCDVINPLRICETSWSWLHCAIVCLWNLVQCDIVYFIPNYKHSKGAKIEHFFAQVFKKVIIYG